MPTPIPEAADGAKQFEWSETLHSFLFRARIYLKRYWWIFLLTISGGIFMQAVRQINSAPDYESHATMVVPPRVITSGLATAGYSEDLVNFYSTQVSLMMSDSIINEAYKWCLLQNNAPAGFTPEVHPDVKQRQSTSILQLSVHGSDGNFTKAFLDKWMDTFIAYKKQQQTDAFTNTQDYITGKMAELEKKIADLVVAQQAFVEKHSTNNTNNLQAEGLEIGASLASLNRAHDEMTGDLALIQKVDLPLYITPRSVVVARGNAAALAAYDENIEEIDRRVLTIRDFITVSPDYEEYNTAKLQLRKLQAERDDLAENLDADHPNLIRYNNRIDEAESSLVRMRIQLKADVDAGVHILNVDIARTDADLKTTKDRASENGQAQVEYDKITYDLTQTRNVYNQLSSTVSGIQNQMGFDQPMLAVYEHASDPAKSFPNPVKQISIGALMGFIAGAMLIFVLGALDGRVMSVEDITQRFDEAMLGVIPMQQRIGGQVALLQNDDQRQMFAESCRNIRSSLLYMDRQGKRPQTILLTSSVPSEGKSTISANLAITLSFAASKTLLIDADLRRGQLHKQFNMSNEVGLAEHLQGELPVEKVIQHTQYENLDFIPCGKYPAQPGELLMTEAFRETMQELKLKYDFIIFDSPPVMATDDTSSFATRTDAVLFVVRAGYTRLRQVRSSLENLHRRSVNVYGMIINFIDHREPGYYSYKYYDYYSYRTPPKE